MCTKYFFSKGLQIARARLAWFAEISARLLNAKKIEFVIT